MKTTRVLGLLTHSEAHNVHKFRVPSTLSGYMPPHPVAAVIALGRTNRKTDLSICGDVEKNPGPRGQGRRAGAQVEHAPRGGPQGANRGPKPPQGGHRARRQKTAPSPTAIVAAQIQDLTERAAGTEIAAADKVKEVVELVVEQIETAAEKKKEEEEKVEPEPVMVVRNDPLRGKIVPITKTRLSNRSYWGRICNYISDNLATPGYAGRDGGYEDHQWNTEAWENVMDRWRKPGEEGPNNTPSAHPARAGHPGDSDPDDDSDDDDDDDPDYRMVPDDCIDNMDEGEPDLQGNYDLVTDDERIINFEVNVTGAIKDLKITAIAIVHQHDHTDKRTDDHQLKDLKRGDPIIAKLKFETTYHGILGWFWGETAYKYASLELLAQMCTSRHFVPSSETSVVRKRLEQFAASHQGDNVNRYTVLSAQHITMDTVDVAMCMWMEAQQSRGWWSKNW